MSIVRTIPRGPWWAFALGLLVFFAGIVVAGLTSSPWPLVACIVGAVAIGAARGFRCQQCGRRLAERKTLVHGGPAYRLFLECRHCSALWDSGQFFGSGVPPQKVDRTLIMETRPMPRKLFLPGWVWFLGFLGAVVASALTNTEWLLLVYFLLLIAQGVYAFVLVRCPTCHGRLKLHKRYLPWRLDYRIQFNCTHCLVTWDTPYFSSDDTY